MGPHTTCLDLFAEEQLLCAELLKCLEIDDWSRFQLSASWCRSQIDHLQPRLRSWLLSRDLPPAPKPPRAAPVPRERASWKELCNALDLLGLWSRLPAQKRLGGGEEEGQEGGVGHEGVTTSQSLPVDEDSGCSLLHLAIAACPTDRRAPGYRRGRLMLLWVLAQPGAAESAMLRNCRGETALHICARRGLEEAASRILQLPGCNVNMRDLYGRTALHIAVNEEHPKVVHVLLRGRADPNILVVNVHGHGATPLMLAVRLRNIGIVRQLLARSNIDLHMKSIVGVPFGKEALEFAPEGDCPLREILVAAIRAREEWSQAGGAGLQKETDPDKPLATNQLGEFCDNTTGSNISSNISSNSNSSKCTSSDNPNTVTNDDNYDNYDNDDDGSSGRLASDKVLLKRSSTSFIEAANALRRQVELCLAGISAMLVIP